MRIKSLSNTYHWVNRMKITILDKVEQYLKVNGWNYGIPSKKDGVIILGFEGTNGRWNCMLQCREDAQQIVFYSRCRVDVPEKHREEVTNFITDTNYRIAVGNYEMDREDGELNFKTGIDIQDVNITEEMIRNLMMINLATYDKMLPKLENIIGNTDDTGLPDIKDLVRGEDKTFTFDVTTDGSKDWDESMGEYE